MIEENPSASHSGKRWSIIIKVLLAIALLNFLTTFNNIWSTPFIKPDTRIGPDLIGLWLIMLALVLVFGSIGPRARAWLTGLFFVAVIGRYAEVTVPAWFGRKVNLYWDAQHLPTFLDVASQEYTWWQIMGMVLGLLIGLWLLFWIIRLCIRMLAVHAAPYAARSLPIWILTLCLTGLVAASLFNVHAVQPYVSKSVLPEFKRQAHLLLASFYPQRFLSSLPATPTLDSDLKVLQGAEVKVIFLESYGATTYERDDLFEAIHPWRIKLEQAANAQGREVLSGFVTAAAFGGASDLSHLSFLSAIDLTDPIRHDLLITTDRPTILDTFENAGYRTIGWYPAMSWDWPEVSFYSYDHYHDAPKTW